MGSAASSDAQGEKSKLRLTLNERRGIPLRENEDFYGVVLFSGAEYLRRGTPIVFPVTSDTILMIEFRAALFGSANNTRTVGSVRLPLQHLWKRCGQSLFYMWFPLNPSLPRAPPSQNEMNNEFDRGLRNAARDPEWPLVCLSLGLAALPEAVCGHYDFSITPNVKSLCFDGLMLSHSQHGVLLQTLYRQVRVLKNLGLQVQKENMYSESEIYANRNSSYSHFVDVPRVHIQREGTLDIGNDILSLSTRRLKHDWHDVEHLQAEIESRNSEAVLRLNKASESIKILDDRLVARQADYERIEQVITCLTHDADELEIENERMVLQLERQARQGTTISQREEECRQLHRELIVLQEQKEALLLILEDLYGSVRGDAPVVRRNHGPLMQKGSPQEGWTNMLPPPSEIME